jgi:hypothetical protein
MFPSMDLHSYSVLLLGIKCVLLFRYGCSTCSFVSIAIAIPQISALVSPEVLSQTFS